MFFREVKLRARLYKSRQGWLTLYVLAKQNGISEVKNKRWVIVKIGDLMFPANVCHKDNTVILTIPKWVRPILKSIETKNLEIEVIVPPSKIE